MLMGDAHDCLICGQISGSPERDLIYSLLGGRYQRPVLLESRSFAVMPSVGPLVPGHVLICPRRHARSFAVLTAAETAEAALMLRTVERRLLDVFGGPVQFFEHGSAPVGTAVACSVEHAHVHALPAAPDLWPIPGVRLRWCQSHAE